jgi:hypothetical protein
MSELVDGTDTVEYQQAISVRQSKSGIVVPAEFRLIRTSFFCHFAVSMNVAVIE